MRVNSGINVKNPIEIRARFGDLARVLNGGIEFGNPTTGPVNMQGTFAEGTTPGSADAEFTLQHNLGYVPTGFFQVSVDQNATLYSSRKAQWTTQELYLKCHLTGVNFTVFIF